MNAQTEEPIIIINGKALSEVEAMTVRCAIESFDNTLRVDGLGDDEHGASMVKNYRANIDSIRDKIFQK